MSGKKSNERKKDKAPEGVPYAQRTWPTYAYMVVLSLIYLVVFNLIKDDRVYLGGDNADYYVLARSIEMGEGYRNVSSLEAPPNNHFPPGYPFIMATLMKFGMTEITTLTAMNGLFFWAALMLLFVVFKRWTGDRELSAVAVLLCILNANLLQFATIMMSEMPYLLCMALALFAYGRYLKADDDRTRWTWVAVLIAASILMLYIRTAGIAVLGAIGLHLLLTRRIRMAFIVVGAVLLSQVPWQVRTAHLGGSSYTKQLLSVNPYRPEKGAMQAHDWPKRITANLKRYFVREVPAALAPWVSRAGAVKVDRAKELPLAVVLAALMLVGVWWVDARWRWLVVPLLIMNGALLLLWPQVWFGVRFILPLIPFLVLFALQGAHGLLSRATARSKWSTYITWGVLTPVLLYYGSLLNEKVLMQGREVTNASLVEINKVWAVRVDPRARICYATCIKGLSADRNNPYPDKFEEYIRTAEWVERNTPRDTSTVVCCRKQSLFYLFSGRYVTGFLKDTDPAALIADLKEKRVSHVVVDQMGFADVGRYLVPVVQRDPLKFPVLHTIPSKLNPKQVTFLLGFKPELGYHGAWENGRKSGPGRWVNTDGGVFEGTWRNDTIVGHGVMRTPDGSVVEGEWHNGQLNGHGRRTRDGVVLHEGLYVNGVPVRER